VPLRLHALIYAGRPLVRHQSENVGVPLIDELDSIRRSDGGKDDTKGCAGQTAPSRREADLNSPQ
jgi:hypothetical protein